jgi:hypothetical protein
MAEYRAYIIGTDGHFFRAVELVCADDATAKEYAKQLVDGHDVELWQGDRKIEAFKNTHQKTEPKPSSASARALKVTG